MDPNLKTIARVGRSDWMLFGLGLLGVGLLIAMLLLIIRPWPIDIGEIAILAGLPVFLGAIFMCVRSGVVIDRQRCTITTWRGLLVPIIYRTRHSFSRSHAVTLSYEVRHGAKNSKHAVYPVRLESPGTDAITIHEPGDHDKARQLAEEIAKFLHLGMRDRSSAEEVVREAGALDLSLRERMKRAGRSMPLPAQPPGARAILGYGGIRSPTTIEIPPMPVGECARWFLIGIPAGAMAIVFELVARLDGNVAIGVATLAIFLPALVILTPVLMRAAILRERLVVSPDEIVVTRRDVFGTTTTRLKGAEVEEVALIEAGYLRAFGSGGKSRVVIRSDRGSFLVGEALSKPGEVHWLRDVLVHVLTVTFK